MNILFSSSFFSRQAFLCLATLALSTLMFSAAKAEPGKSDLTLKSISTSLKNVVPGDDVTGTVTLTGIAMSDITVKLSADPTHLTIPTSVIVPAGSSSADFSVGILPNTNGDYHSYAMVAEYPAGVTRTVNEVIYQTFFRPISKLSPTVIPSGGSATLTLYLFYAAQFDMDLPLTSSDSSILSASATIHIPTGASTVIVPLTAGSVNVSYAAQITCAYLTNYQLMRSATVQPVVLTGLTITPTAVDGGTDATGTVTLSAVAPAGGTDVAISKKFGNFATAPPSCTVPTGKLTGTFVIHTGVPPSPNTNEFQAALRVAKFIADLTVNTGNAPGVQLLKVETNSGPPDRVVKAGCPSGSDMLGTVYANGIAVNDMLVNLSTNDPDAFFDAPKSVIIAKGTDRADFICHNKGVDATKVITITASTFATGGGGPVSTDYNLKQYVKSISVDRVGAAPGDKPSFLVTMVGPTKNGVTVTLSEDRSELSFPLTVKIPGGATAATFTATVKSVVDISVTIHVSAAFGNITRTCSLKLYHSIFKSFTLTPSTMPSSSTSTGTVTLNFPVLDVTNFTLTNSDTTALTVPATVHFDNGSSVGTFTATAHSTSLLVAGALTVTKGSFTKKIGFKVQPIYLTGLTISPTSVLGGTSTHGTFTLSAPVPPGGIVVTMASTSTFATVKPSVTVLEGKTFLTFTIKTTKPLATTTSKITVTFGGKSKTGVVTITVP